VTPNPWTFPAKRNSLVPNMARSPAKSEVMP
jgi:hypothetical protein